MRSARLAFWSASLLAAASACGGSEAPRASPPTATVTVAASTSNRPDPWPDHSVRRWAARWTGDGWAYDAVLTLRNDGGRVAGEIAWTLVRPGPDGMPAFAGRVGHSAVEHVTGTWSVAESRLDLSGVAVSDPTLISTDTYALIVATDGSLSGRTITNDMDWSGVLVGRAL